MARPSKYTPEAVKKITDAIRIGATYRLACDYAGIDQSTFDNWRARYSDFSDKLREAEGAGAVASLAKIEQAATAGDWRAAAWKMERRHPQEYGKTVSEVQGKDGAPISVDLDPRDSLASRIASIAIRAGTQPVDQESTA